ncbi:MULTISPECIES: hypothetical protein [unclassified Bacillus (in: firmicutes)]|uniref:hypothetical protein n=1 Tax=unclassified Bacillus (in: firmicutes) TaxID=185979 RepID=UPI0020C8FF57|nr:MULTISPECIES: hypothetical protein [unclassified Bacillus (in: firmicutes)]
MTYTKEKVTIETSNGEILTSSKWSKGEAQKNDFILKQVSIGYYQNWSDELCD